MSESSALTTVSLNLAEKHSILPISSTTMSWAWGWRAGSTEGTMASSKPSTSTPYLLTRRGPLKFTWASVRRLPSSVTASKPRRPLGPLSSRV